MDRQIMPWGLFEMMICRKYIGDMIKKVGVNSSTVGRIWLTTAVSEGLVPGFRLCPPTKPEEITVLLEIPQDVIHPHLE